MKSTFVSCTNKGWKIKRSDIYPQLDKSKGWRGDVQAGWWLDRSTGRLIDRSTERQVNGKTDWHFDSWLFNRSTSRQLAEWRVNRLSGRRLTSRWVYRSTCQSSNRRPVDQLFCIDRWLITHFYWLHLKSILFILHTYPIFNEYTKPIYSL